MTDEMPQKDLISCGFKQNAYFLSTFFKPSSFTQCAESLEVEPVVQSADTAGVLLSDASPYKHTMLNHAERSVCSRAKNPRHE